MRAATLAHLAAAVVAAAIVLAACGAGGASGDPTAVVKDYLSLVEQKQFAKIPDVACSAEVKNLASQFDLENLLAGSLQGVDAKTIADAMTIRFENVDVKEVEKSADKAKVSLTGDLTLSVDKAKLSGPMKTALAAQGLSVDDATVSAMLDSVVAGFAQGEPIDESVDLVVQNGKWVVCGITP